MKSILVALFSLSCILAYAGNFSFQTFSIVFKNLNLFSFIDQKLIYGVDASCDDCEQNPWATSNMVKGLCSRKASCYQGKCWAYCDEKNVAWCWTTKLGPKSGNYVQCSRDSQCNPCWSCAGECGT